MRKRIKYALVFISGVTAGFGTCGFKALSYAAKKGYLKVIVKDVLNRKIDTIFSYEYYVKTYSGKANAEEVLTLMQNTINDYGWVSLADVREYMLDETVYCMYKPYQATLYGWIALSDFDVVRTRSGYELRIPKPTRLQ